LPQKMSLCVIILTHQAKIRRLQDHLRSMSTITVAGFDQVAKETLEHCNPDTLLRLPIIGFPSLCPNDDILYARLRLESLQSIGLSLHGYSDSAQHKRDVENAPKETAQEAARKLLEAPRRGDDLLTQALVDAVVLIIKDASPESEGNLVHAFDNFAKKPASSIAAYGNDAHYQFVKEEKNAFEGATGQPAISFTSYGGMKGGMKGGHI